MIEFSLSQKYPYLDVELDTVWGEKEEYGWAFKSPFVTKVSPGTDSFRDSLLNLILIMTFKQNNLKKILT